MSRVHYEPGHRITLTRPDTKIHNPDSDTFLLKLDTGARVRIAGGALEGLEGEVVELRANGRALVSIGPSQFVEVHQICLEKIK